ncbi:MAG TPA: hypothetical protein VJZ27_04345, partial [Aggregatilineales bacterium]|nr:hypothetical protein [Aggregatilineales bacterium]
LRDFEDLLSGEFPATTDPRIDAIALLAPAAVSLYSEASLESITMPVIILVGSADMITPPESNAYRVYERITTGQKYRVTFTDAGHYVFVDACSPLAISFGFFDHCSDLVWDMARVHDLTDHFVTAFFREVLYADTDAAAALQPTQNDFIGVEVLAAP